jgi:hypothetical protein
MHITMEMDSFSSFAEVAPVQKSLMLAAVLTLGLTARAMAAPPAPAKAEPAPASSAFDRLIEQLGDADFRKRDEATRLLEAQGMKALPALKKALGNPDAEVRRRAHDLLPRLEVAALVAPRRVTLKMANKPLRAIFDEMTKQTGYKIEFWTAPANTGRTYSIDFQDIAFWPALDRICRDANLVLQHSYGDERIILQSQGGHVPHVQHEGAFRFVPTGFQMYRNLEFGLVGGGGELQPQHNESLTLSFLVFSEPRIPLLGIGEPRLEAAYDSDKNSMLVPLNASADGMPNMAFGMMGGRAFVTHYGNGNRSYMQQGQFNLHRPSQRANKVKSIRGTLPVTLLVEQKPVVVNDNILKAKGKKGRVGNTTFHFEDVTALANKQYQIKMNVTEDNKENPNDWTWMNTLYNRIELQDSKGNKFQVHGSSWGNSGPNNVQMTLTYGPPPNGKAGPPSKFVFQQWRTLQHQVRFEFKDLPLP